MESPLISMMILLNVRYTNFKFCNDKIYTIIGDTHNRRVIIKYG